MASHTALNRYAQAIRNGNSVTKSVARELSKGLCGRLIRGKKSSDFETLTDDPSRVIVMLVGDDGLESLLGKSGYEMLIEIGYTQENIQRKVVDEGNQFKLVVLPSLGPVKLATWDNVAEMVGELYPQFAEVINRTLPFLKAKPFEYWENLSGYRWSEVDKAGRSDQRFMTADRLATYQREGNVSAWAVRAFLYHTVHLRELYSGDGYTYTVSGTRGMKEYIVPNRPIASLGESVLIDLKIDIPLNGTKGNIMPSKKYPYELPLPSFFDPQKVGDWKWHTNYAARFAEANAWAIKNKLRSPALDALRIAVMPIDCQLTFCNPDFELYVGGRSGTGAIDDTTRLCEFILRNLGVISKVHPTLDTHSAYQIFHATFLVDDKGNHPDPRFPTQIAAADIIAGKWKVDPRAAYAIFGDAAKYSGLQQHLVHYAKSLEAGGKYGLTTWPFHGMLGSQGHALVPALEEVIFFHSIARGVQTDFQIKGGNPLTENYSVLRPEVMTGASGAPIAQKNTNFIRALLEHDVVIIAGQAKSHCVAWTIEDLLREITAVDPELAKKVYLLEDCTSSVVVPNIVDFTPQGDDAFKRFAAAGMNVVTSSTPIAEWPGIDRSRLS